MNKQQFPSGWDEARVQRLIEHYENMSEEDLLAEDEAAREAGQSRLAVPNASPRSNGVQQRKNAAKPKPRPRTKRRAGK